MRALVKLDPLTLLQTSAGPEFPPFMVEGVYVMCAPEDWAEEGHAILPYQEQIARPHRFADKIGTLISIEDGVVIGTAEWQSPALSEVKARLAAEIDAAAGTARSGFITVSAGQEMTYQAKLAEARRWSETADPQDADFVLLSFEVGITAPTMEGVVDVVLNQNAMWELIGGSIEGKRLGAKKAVNAAGSIEEAIAVADGITWPAP
ncbi:hypothetical protein [Terrihabitans rhizophilus]|uniref:DUF4376 domain-containing protein n=1 Tax=Terrihabitans rhizophilus TaxID=3092662 RepID=A0ABU4RN90_9HYPH|nr:hypothetical protein [Terrihabitans sp. PJ23]MDX6806307.1 hypothetical protein [Terrihabitans sp. PJ23]